MDRAWAVPGLQLQHELVTFSVAELGRWMRSLRWPSSAQAQVKSCFLSIADS